jgi:hypothetical protein
MNETKKGFGHFLSYEVRILKKVVGQTFLSAGRKALLVQCLLSCRKDRYLVQPSTVGRLFNN